VQGLVRLSATKTDQGPGRSVVVPGKAYAWETVTPPPGARYWNITVATLEQRSDKISQTQ